MNVQQFNAVLASRNLPWRIEPVFGITSGYVLSDRGPVRSEIVIRTAAEFGLGNDATEIDDFLAPETPLRGMAGFVVKDDDPATPAELIVWAAWKLDLDEIVPAHLLEERR